MIGQNSESNPLILVSMVASHTHIDDANFFQVGCVEMVMAGLPVAVYCKDVLIVKILNALQFDQRCLGLLEWV